MPGKPVIEIKNLSKSYGKRLIWENVSFDVYPGEIICIVGGSGCGKSTLLRQMIGLEFPTSGQVLIKGKDFVNAKEKERIEIQKMFGVMFQLSGLFASMNLAENIALPLETYTKLNREQIEAVTEMKLASVGLNGFQNYFPSELSGGMKKRAALARAMALDPEILFFDEPSSGLDPVTAASLDKLIIELNRGLNTTMIIVTHDLASILSIAHRIIMLDSSVPGIIAQGTPEELKNFTQNINVYNFFNRIPEL